MKQLILLIWAVLPFTVQAQTNATITVNPANKMVSIPDNFIGMSHEMSDIGGGKGNIIWDSTNFRYVNYHKTLGVKTVRIGANLVDYSVWRNEPRTENSPSNALTKTDVDKFFGFMKKIEAQSIFALNFAGHFDPELAADEVNYIYNNHRNQLQYIEIGNEPDFYHFHNDIKPTSYYYNQWKPEYTQYLNALLEKVPQAPISGPSTANDFATFTTPYANDFYGKYNILTHHNYGGGNHTIERMLSPEAMADLTNMGTDLDNLSKSKGVPYKMTEMNSYAGGGQNGVSNVYASALWVMDAMYTMAAKNCKGICFHNANDLASPYTPIRVVSPTQYEPRPICYGIMAFKAGSKGQLTQTTVTDGNPNLKVYTVVDDLGKMYVTIINKNSSEDFTINLNPGDAKYTYAEGLRLTGDALNSAANVQLGDSFLNNEGLWSPKTREQFTKKGTSFAVSIPRTSAIVITISEKAPVVLSGKVEAEDHIKSSGIITGSCEDVGGGQAIGHISNNDFVQYDASILKSGTYTLAFRVASASEGGTIRLKSGNNLLKEVEINNTGGWNTWETITTEVDLQKGRQVLILEFVGSAGDFMNINWFEAQLNHIPIPGRLEAEDYNDYYGLQTGPSNDDASDGLGHISKHEWVSYEVDVAHRGNYGLSFRVASGSDGGTIILKSNEESIKTINIPGTDAWGNWINVKDNVLLEAGKQTLEFYFDGGTGDYMNLNWVDFITIPQLLPGKIEAEAYADQFGTENQATTDAGGGKNVAFIDNGDWLLFQPTIEKNTLYRFDFRVASATTGGTIEISVDGVKKSTVNVTGTSGWQSWKMVSDTILLPKGNHELKFTFLGTESLFNLNWFSANYITDYNGEYSGTAFMDSCGICAGGNTGNIPVTNPEECTVTHVKTFSDKTIEIYPNPFDEILHISIPDGAVTEIYNLNGTQVWKGALTNQNLKPEISPGMYLLKIFQQGTVITRLIYKSR